LIFECAILRNNTKYFSIIEIFGSPAFHFPGFGWKLSHISIGKIIEERGMIKLTILTKGSLAILIDESFKGKVELEERICTRYTNQLN